MRSIFGKWFSGLVTTAFVAAGLATSTAASAGVVFGFNLITNNGGAPAIVPGQLTVEVSDAGGGQVDFIFRNAGPSASSITDVYFDDGTLLGIASVLNSTGVDFVQNASPPDLPGGNAVNFQTTAGFSADSTNPTSTNGVNPGEELTVRFNLLPGLTYADTLAAILGGQDLRIGIHVQAFGNGQSESFVNNGPPFTPPLPEPATLALLGAGLAGLALVRRRRRD